MDEEEMNTEFDEDDDTESDEYENDVDSDIEDEFEYDENGDIVIPEIDVEEQDSESEDDEGVDEADEEKTAESVEEETQPEPEEDERDKKILELQKQLAKLTAQGKETLAKLGVQADDVLDGLEKIAAESEDITLEEYRKKKAESQSNDEARKILQQLEFEKKMKADFAELQREYPQTKNLKSITEIENFAKFGKLRDLGLSPKEAYAAANADSIRNSVAKAAKQQSLNETKAHLKSAVPKGSKDESIVMPKKELVAWRDLFPNMSDKEITKLYKESLKK